MQQQSGRTDCGLFATAFALHTVMRNNFKTICFEQSLMKQHLLECLQNETLTEFPQSTSPSANPRRSKVSHIVINLFCTCRMPESFDSKMIECDRCADWFHFKCVGLKKNTTSVNWMCTCPPDSIIILIHYQLHYYCHYHPVLLIIIITINLNINILYHL